MRPDPIAALAESWGDAADSTDWYDEHGWRHVPRYEAAAIAKRVRRASKRAEDERRTAEGRASYTPPAKLGFRQAGWFTGWSVRLAQWDGAPYEMEWPRWRIRSRERRALPGMERPWWAQPSAQARGQVAGWSRGLVRRHVEATRSVRGGAL